MSEVGETPIRTRHAGRTGADPRQRQRNTRDVLTHCRELRELEDGFVLVYPASDAWAAKLEAFAAAWRRSCPHMSFEIEAVAERLELAIRGPEGTKEFVQGARYILTSHINPAPSLGLKLRLGLRLLTSPLRPLPDFLIVGAKKCGTTALYSYLTQHPSVASAARKEISYFSTDPFYAKGAAWYRAFFPTVLDLHGPRLLGRPRTLVGEATPDYLFHPHAPGRVHDTLPHARFIAILRDPVERAHSLYNHNLRAGVETLSFEDAVEEEAERLRDGRGRTPATRAELGFDDMLLSYLLRGIYVDQLRNWRTRFPAEQMLVLRTEDLYREPVRTLERAFSFLGLPYHEPAAFKKLNTAPYPDMNPATRERLERFFEPHNRELYEFLGEDLGW